MNALYSLTVAVVVLLRTASPARAQAAVTPPPSERTTVFRGVVVDKQSGRPLAGADVWLTSVDKRAATDSAGVFQFANAAPGAQVVQVRHVGFEVQRDTLTILSGRENIRQYALVSQPTQLDTVRVVAAERKYISPALRGFEERRLSGQGGRFISDSVLRRNENTTLANLVVGRIPGVAALGGRVLVSARKQCRGLVFQPAVHSVCQVTGRSDCYVTIRVDGAVYFTAQMAENGIPPPDLTKEIDVSNLTGIEFYADGAAAPAGMQTSDQGCGTLWLWTREK